MMNKDKEIILKIKEKKEFSELPDSLVEKVLARVASTDDKSKIKEVRKVLRKVFTAFLTDKLIRGKLEGEEILKKHGLIQSLTICDSEHRFDFRDDTHHHFLCKKCGRIIDINIDCPNMNKPTEYGHIVDEVHGYFKGTCKKCLKKEK